MDLGRAENEFFFATTECFVSGASRWNPDFGSLKKDTRRYARVTLPARGLRREAARLKNRPAVVGAPERTIWRVGEQCLGCFDSSFRIIRQVGMMRKKAVLYLCAVIAVALLMWNLCKGPPIRDIKDVFGIPKAATVQTRTPKTSPKCNLSRNCSFDHFPFSITSGAADVVGPKICFDGKIVLSHVLNNVGPGMNIVLVNGKNGKIETTDFFNLNYNQPKESAAYLRAIKPGTIVLVASFGDISTIMTDEVSDIFLGLGSSLVKSLKGRDNWVFAGYSGTEMKSLFERMAVNDAKTNPYGEWPGVVELGGCFPRKA